MTLTVTGLALFAAILHAGWNAFLRSGADRFWTVTVMSFSSTAVALPLLWIYPAPVAAAWPYIALSALLQTGYSVFLAAAYRHGNLGQVYPIVRGTVPLLVTVYQLLLVGQYPGPLGAAGVLLVGLGIMSLSLGRPVASARSVVLAIATGALIACYATVDALGVRLSGHGMSYTAWVLALYGILLPATFLAVRRSIHVDMGSMKTWKALGGGLVAMLAYAAVVAAFALGPAGPITALRETSVIFAVLIGWLFLGEPPTARRILACFMVATGAILLGMGA